MNVYPPEVTKAAKTLLTNSDFATLLSYRMNELKEDVINSVEEKEIMEAHRELTDLRLFAEWITHIGETKPQRQTQQ